MKRFCRFPSALPAALALIAVVALGDRVAQASQGPRDVVSETVQQVLDVLKAKSLDSDAKRHRIEDIAYARFDFPTISRLVLARNWSRLSPEQQARFIDEFKRHLSVTYGRNIDNYHNEKVEVLSDREEARGDWSVKSKILRGGPNEDIQVDYRLRKAGDEWKVIDVTIEGVSLVANFRAQFQEIVANGGPDHLLTLLAQKNAAGESILPPGKGVPGGGV
ncbi:MAG TPA: ABC transporter substrate-binding protein [Candidatus Binatia bacterium]|nr:ABC transporter substrate-binding protein [Candidatus Binatia bacterium]